MPSSFQANRLNMEAFARDGASLGASTLLQDMKRLAQESNGLQPDVFVHWRARAEVRPHPGSNGYLWLHLQANAQIPLTCQRCMATVFTPLNVNQWYRFVANEDIAMAEDDQSDEDLLVMEQQFDLLSLLEDELLMALPLVAMHEECPLAPTLHDGAAGIAGESVEKPNPFATLAQIKKRNQPV